MKVILAVMTTTWAAVKIRPERIIINLLSNLCLVIYVSLIRHILYVICSKMIKSVSVGQVVKFTGNTRHCKMPVLSYEMAVPFMFNFIKIKLQEVGKQKPDTFHEQVVP